MPEMIENQLKLSAVNHCYVHKRSIAHPRKEVRKTDPCIAHVYTAEASLCVVKTQSGASEVRKTQRIIPGSA